MQNKIYPSYFIAIPLALYLMFTIIPAVMGLGLSFTDWNRFTSDINYVGFENFKEVFSSEQCYVSYIANSLYFTTVTIILKTVLGLLLALLLHEGVKRFAHLYRAFIFLPAILPMVVMNRNTANYAEMKERGFLLANDSNYNPFLPEARALYWRQAHDGLFHYGLDA